jgi:hypothetical protein
MMRILIAVALLLSAAISAPVALAEEFDIPLALQTIGTCSYLQNVADRKATVLAAYWKAYVEGLSPQPAK